MNNNNMKDYASEALEEMKAKGHEVDKIICDGSWQRFGRKGAGWYIARQTDYSFLVSYGDFSTGDKGCYKSTNPNISIEDRLQLNSLMKDDLKKYERLKKEHHDKVASECAEEWKTLSDTGISPYLDKKMINKPYGARYRGDTLVIPIYNSEGKIRSFQTVDKNSNKRFHAGGQTSGCFHIIGDPSGSETLLVAEGFSTAASIHQATDLPVVVAFSAHNLTPVTKAFMKKYPKKEIIVCGDDDKWKINPDGNPKPNVGREAATEASKISRTTPIFPFFAEASLQYEPTDFNDLQAHEGLAVVGGQIEAGIKISRETKSPDEPEEGLEPLMEMKKPSQAKVLIEIAWTKSELFHGSNEDSYASIKIREHHETYKIKSEGFRKWLSYEFYKLSKTAPSAQAMADAMLTINAKAQFEGPKHDIFMRIGKKDNKVYVDLVNDEWEVVEIDSTGWRVLTDSPLRFCRSKGMKELPRPVVRKQCSIEILNNFINIGSGDDLKLLASWILSAYNPNGPYLVLVLHGEQGSAKSTAAQILRELIDPNETPLRKQPKNSDDLIIQAKHNWVFSTDNVSHLEDWLSDDLCRLSTGGGLSKRTLYSDDEETVIKAKRPILLNGIESFVTRGDLASRAIVICLPKISPEKRTREADLWSSFETSKPQLLGTIFSALSEALKNENAFQLPQQLRMADAWHWITAAETSFGWERGSCVEAFKRNQDEANNTVLESTVLYALVSKFLISASGEWKGTPTELLRQLNIIKNHVDYSGQPSPDSPKALSDLLRRLSPAFQIANIEITMGKTPGSNSERFIQIRKLDKVSDATVAPAQFKCDESDASSSGFSN